MMSAFDNYLKDEFCHNEMMLRHDVVRDRRSLAAPAGSVYWPLFKHMADNHGLTLLDSEMEDICQVVARMGIPMMPGVPKGTLAKITLDQLTEDDWRDTLIALRWMIYRTAQRHSPNEQSEP